MSQRLSEKHIKCPISFNTPHTLKRLGQLLPHSAGVENEAHKVDGLFQHSEWQSRCGVGLSPELLPFSSPSIPLTFPDNAISLITAELVRDAHHLSLLIFTVTDLKELSN